MNSGNPTSVTIVGAGLAGLSLALSLRQYSPSIQVSMYELREPTMSTTGALMLSPNALQILDYLGVYQKVKVQGYEFEKLSYQDSSLATTDTYSMGSQKIFGYKALRVCRQVLLKELRATCKDRGIEVAYARKFSKVVSEDASGVTFEFEDGSQETSSLLIGTDGIYSTVRKYIYPDVIPKYSGMMAVTSTISSSALRTPKDDGNEHPMPVSVHIPIGAWVMAPQNPDGTELLVGTQNRHAELDKAGWAELKRDDKKLLSILTANQKQWPDYVQSAMENINIRNLGIWPFYVVPYLSTWFSSKKRVIIMGDAAHAIPPTAGQGASQAFEDVFSFSYLVSKLTAITDLDKVLESWQAYRRERVGKVVLLTSKLNNRRLPEAAKAKLSEADFYVEEGKEGQRWLFDPKIKESIDALIMEFA
ncbi:hypothetical protein BJ875DRAFT_489218 [Amylocarpus encephaloides]|uniref:FAD-binding domain-containing protein n=1 Tax=Amylocarpus encephaloides TaxID=45428 RepID=A0A9P7Y8J9_9HELO|nr:hypothetical protein BJ875DRAFT_489218 [Amylocarpus encephaloides]